LKKDFGFRRVSGGWP